MMQQLKSFWMFMFDFFHQNYILSVLFYSGKWEKCCSFTMVYFDTSTVRKWDLFAEDKQKGNN